MKDLPFLKQTAKAPENEPNPKKETSVCQPSINSNHVWGGIPLLYHQLVAEINCPDFPG